MPQRFSASIKNYVNASLHSHIATGEKWSYPLYNTELHWDLNHYSFS